MICFSRLIRSRSVKIFFFSCQDLYFPSCMRNMFWVNIRYKYLGIVCYYRICLQFSNEKVVLQKILPPDVFLFTRQGQNWIFAPITARSLGLTAWAAVWHYIYEYVCILHTKILIFDHRTRCAHVTQNMSFSKIVFRLFCRSKQMP